MTPQLKLTISRYILIATLASTLGLTAYFAMSAVALYRNGIQVHKPIEAVELSKAAAPFQNGTPPIDGMFKLLIAQHMDAQIIFARLDAETRNRWENSIIGTAGGLMASIFILITNIILGRIDSISARNRS